VKYVPPVSLDSPASSSPSPVPPTPPTASRQATILAAGYLAAAVTWIVVTDMALATATLPAGWEVALQTLKGILFVTLSAGLIWWLVRRALARHERAERELETARVIYEELAEQNRERTKELTCLYAVAERMHGEPDPEAAVAQLPPLLPGGWRDPDRAEACVTLGGRSHRTEGFRETEWRLEAPIVVDGEDGGRVTVAYREPPADGADPFLPEERELIRHIAREIGGAVARARAESERRRSEAYFRALTEHSNDLTTVFGVDGTILYQSRASERMLGRSPEGREGGSVFDHIHPDDRGRLREMLAEGLRERDRTIRAVFRIQHANGEWRWFETVARNLVDDPAVGGLMAHSRDITERRHAEEQLRFHAHLLDEVGQAVVAADLEGTVVYWNRTAAELLERAPEEAEGQPLSTMLAVDDGEGLLGEMVERAIERGRDDREVRVRGGREIPVPAYVTVTCFRDEEGLGLGTVVVITDLTEQRALQRQLERAQRMEAVGRLAGGVAHDFNNILTGIRGFSQMALEELQGHVAREDVEEIRRSTDRAVELTRQLLAFGRRQVLQPRVVDLDRTIREMQRMLHQMAGDDVNFTLELGSDLPPACVDPAQIEQVLVNLVVNARDAIAGTGRIALRTRAATVREPRPLLPTGTLEPGRYAVIEVEDTGSGIPPDLVERIFEPFFSTKGETKGTGLGLSTVYGVVEQSGGVLDLDTEPGRGTRFTIYLPAARDDRKTPGPQGDADPPGIVRPNGPEARGTVLLVEDDDAVRVLVRRILGREGYTVLEAETPARALELAGERQEEIRLVLSDMVMPEMDGPELLRRLGPLIGDASTILMSGYAAEEVMERGRRSADRFIAKPFAPAALIEAVREVLSTGEESEV
jgi:two-component system, cell cycle sensor histidine kinase and response regulator CckA